MEARFNKTENCLVIVPSARLDSNSSPEVGDRLTSEIESGVLRIVFDFSETEYISSAGLRVLLMAAKLFQPTDGKLALCNANDQIVEVLDISGFFDIFKYFDDLESATEFVCG